MRILCVVFVFAMFAFAACTDAAAPASVTEQALCTVEDWEQGNCPDSAWRIRRAVDYGHSIYPGERVVAAGCAQLPSEIFCWAEFEIVGIDCIWGTSDPNAEGVCYVH
jgi:hypothetical protein